MFLITKREWKVRDAGNYIDIIISIGRHEIEKVVNPFGYNGYWLVLKGTLIGATELSWKQWEEDHWGDFQVIIEE